MDRLPRRARDRGGGGHRRRGDGGWTFAQANRSAHVGA